MANVSTFEALVLDLSPSERADLLDRLQKAFTVSTEPLFQRIPAAESRIDYKAAYRELGLITRIYITVRSLLGGGTKEELVKERVLRSLIKNIEATSVGLIEPRRRVLQEAVIDAVAPVRLEDGEPVLAAAGGRALPVRVVV